ncbi:histidine ammonia-lyase [Bacillus sp. FJAT-26390]|uniref:histidine ammonia-lyase n=1 Tax=Bacillus sp. FJAT-26390 TaxID=1743142 RepID=UPI000807C3DC|nr:histidine ammonia-lyase [Bacillus sp. FJAT-26390]OBZ16979.1 histidine ammonia-lyase [Bacillus sp. FJAT-26390]
MGSILIDGRTIRIDDVAAVARKGWKVELAEDVKAKINKCRSYVDRFVAEQRPVYGITTGLGELCKVSLTREEAAKLSKNVVMSHACGVGEPLKADQVRAILFAAVVNFSQGYSGIRLETVETLIQMLNEDVTPWVPSQGSVGYLTHMAHISLVVIGLGEAYYKGRLLLGAEAMEEAGISTLELKEKEGLSLVNGTVCMSGISALAIFDCMQLAKWADIAGAMSFEALKGTYYAFDERIHRVRPFKGQLKVADNLRRLIACSEISEQSKDRRIQDALSIRSIPQVHGACRDKMMHAAEIVEMELNSATDNPLIFDDGAGGISISACNAHGEPLALTMDMTAIAVAELANIAERRIDRLVNPHTSELPAFLVEKGGLNSGFMITQYVAASLVAENKVLSHPISVDSIPTSAFQEDHVSMGTPAALKAVQVIRNAFKVIAIELLTAAQALEFHKPLQYGAGTGTAYALIRNQVPKWTEDRVFYPDLQKMFSLVEDDEAIRLVEAKIGLL